LIREVREEGANENGGQWAAVNGIYKNIIFRQIKIPAATDFPTEFPPKYHRRWRA
jgi:hypothetical protein